MDNRIIGKALVAAAGTAVGGVAAAKWLGVRVTRDATPRNRWLMVTVNVPADSFPGEDELPEPITKLRDRADVTIRPAPGGHGTELGLRPIQTPPGITARIAGTDPRQELRKALRAAKSIIETGEVIRPDEQANRPTPAGRVMDYALERAAGEGRL